jgi:hypothetical protein
MRLIGGIALLLVASVAMAAPTDEAKDHYKRGLAAYALGDYTSAATEYEKAFSLLPDPALLYNAAQAYRLAGNATRALFLYQNYLRLFSGQVSNKPEVERHIRDLKAVVEQQKKAQTAPPIDPQPIAPKSEPFASKPVEPPPPKPEVAVVTPPSRHVEPPKHVEPPPPETTTTPPPTTPRVDLTPPPTTTAVAQPIAEAPKPVWKKAWFWGVIGGAVVVVAVGVGLGVGLSGGDKDPTPSYGAVTLK